ncbi:hypothetical protein BpHYR1_049722 [Brachionus plicatilis]|uniref:Uncharacterized protein n=1 Tax=Brachionus plicatilis TaxID=10195 RepID=A0A3M7QIU7_BRAPC|nr:hypothetical protein BpHYR1_049722 [Brachionus plicatilis]
MSTYIIRHFSKNSRLVTSTSVKVISAHSKTSHATQIPSFNLRPVCLCWTRRHKVEDHLSHPHMGEPGLECT